MAEESTPEIQESAPEATTLDAILEGSIGEIMEKGEESIPSKEETQTSSLPDIPEDTKAETTEEGSEELDQKATGEEEETPTEEVSTSEETTEEAEETEESQDTSLSAPENWNSEDREMFDSLPLNAKERLLKREKEMTADYTRKTQDLAENRKKFEALEGVLEPARQMILSTGISEAEYVSRLIAADTALKQNPLMALKQIAQGLGVNLSSLNEENESGIFSEEQNPHIAQLQQELQTVRTELGNIRQTNIRAQTAQHEETINTFASSKDQSGNLLYPHFEKVKTKMGALLKAGEAEDLTSAYNKAIRLDDDLYKKSLENEKTLAKKEEEKRRKLAVEKARKVKPKSGNPPKGSTQATDLDSMLMSSIESAGVTTS